MSESKGLEDEKQESRVREKEFELPLFEELEDYLKEVYSSDDDSREFLGRHLHLFVDCESENEESKLEFWNVFKEYQALYERKLEAFLKLKDINEIKFKEMCEEAMLISEDHGGHREFIELLIASFDYKKFLRLMIFSVGEAKSAGLLPTISSSKSKK